MKILVTGGCGFIGNHYIRLLLGRGEDSVVNLDSLTYAGKSQNVADLESDRYQFVKGNIGDRGLVEELFSKHDFDAVVNFAAETHVDNSIKGPRVFIESNVNGVLNLLECAYHHWREQSNWQERRRFLQISTDEVYGSLPEDRPLAKFSEQTPLDPSSPYSASKASADLLVMSYRRTFGMPVLITRSSNNYGPRQDPEKLVPLMIERALQNQKLPVYGDGKNIRDWLHVEDNCRGVDIVLRKALPGSIYNIGGSNEHQNLTVVKLILEVLNKPESLIEFVKDRPGHDRRYAIDDKKVLKDLGWKPQMDFARGLRETVLWYEDRHTKICG